MINISLSLSMILSLLLSTVPESHAALAPPVVTVRVRILESTPELRLRGTNLKFAGYSTNEQTDWTVICTGQKIRLIPKFPRSSFATTTDLIFQSPLLIRSSDAPMTVNSNSYRGNLEVRTSGDGCEVINHLDIERYLDGLINSEFSSKWNEESVSAQVIAARTYAYYQIQSHRTSSRVDSQPHFDLDASVKDQVYQGIDPEDHHSTQIVDRTRGMVLVSPNPIKAFYHSTCGGQTELPEKVWGAKFSGFKRQITCPFCKDSPVYDWNLKLNTADIATALLAGIRRSGIPPGWPRNAVDLIQTGRLIEIRPVSSGTSPRVGEVLLIWQGPVRTVIPMSGTRFREWMGFSKLRSTWFKVENSKNAEWLFHGRGNGHGVGMCQWGVKVMGERGFRFASILHFYYPDAILKKLW